MLPGKEDRVNQAIDINLNKAFEDNQKAVARTCALLTMASAIYESEGHREEAESMVDALVVLSSLNEAMTGLPYDEFRKIIGEQMAAMAYETPIAKLKMN
jgi:hypothetical protein